MIKSGLRAIHPGEFVREILEDRSLSQAQYWLNLQAEYDLNGVPVCGPPFE